MRYMVSDAQNGSSIRNCLMAARENARAVRGTLTTEVWETQNQTWLEFQRLIANDKFLRDPSTTFEWVKFRSHLSRGVTVGTMLQDEAFHFLRIGSFLERADNTARLLDVKYHILLPEDETVGGVVDRDQWTTILQTVSAVTAYRWLYSDGLSPANVIDLLIARHELPRSLAASVEESVELLSLLAKRTGHHGEADRMARGRHARMMKTRSADVILGGLHQYLETFLAENADLHFAIGRQFKFA
jgi:uncharacterized alpha-E superfamily protein